jgi:DNA-binding LacI/PurR family transcriptional regulator
MVSSDTPVERISNWIDRLLVELPIGGRLPTVRAMMKQFRTGQKTVLDALAPFVSSGRLSVRRGEGIVILDPSLSLPRIEHDADVLVLYRLSDSRLARNVLLEIEGRLRPRGISMLQIGYATEGQAISLLERIGRFKVGFIQLHFETLSMRFLAALHAHCDHLVIDGVSATGIEADGMGTNWREALSSAFHRLYRVGHRRIAFLTSAHSARQIAMARREYLGLCQVLTPESKPYLLEVDRLPGNYRSEDMVAALRAVCDGSGHPPFTALVVWGVVEGYLLERTLAEMGWTPGVDIGVILLGSVDFPSEHRNTFDTVGNSNAEKLDLFEGVITARVKGETWPAQTHYLTIHSQSFGSLAEHLTQV